MNLVIRRLRCGHVGGCAQTWHGMIRFKMLALNLFHRARPFRYGPDKAPKAHLAAVPLSPTGGILPFSDPPPSRWRPIGSCNRASLASLTLGVVLPSRQLVSSRPEAVRGQLWTLPGSTICHAWARIFQEELKNEPRTPCRAATYTRCKEAPRGNRAGSGRRRWPCRML